jgi:hypothetical protein
VKVAESVNHYAIIGSGRTAANPSGLARRRHTPSGRIDESLGRDLSWKPTSAITQWEYGNLPGELVEISEADAAQLIERFREKWDAQQGSGN